MWVGGLSPSHLEVRNRQLQILFRLRFSIEAKKSIIVLSVSRDNVKINSADAEVAVLFSGLVIRA